MTTRHPTRQPSPETQQGNILLVALVLLAAMTILALSTGFSSLSEEKSARSYRDGTVAFNAAEDAARRVQLQLLDNISRIPLPACSAVAVNGYTPASGTTGLCQSASNTDYLIALTDSSTGKPLLDSLAFSANDNRAATFSSWTSSNITASGTTVASAESVSAPKYFVEVFNAPNPNGELAGSSLSGNLNMNETNTGSNAIKQYRVTASGYGPERLIGNPATQTIESTFQ